MTSTASAYNRYRTDAVATLSPGQALVALYDRLVLDLDRAVVAHEMNNLVAMHASLVHAQDILAELVNSLDVDAWSPAKNLAALYEFVIQELIDANITKDSAKVASCREIIAPLAETWREAAGVVGRAG